MYRNYGDVNFFEHGLLVAHDETKDKNGFYILHCEPLDYEDEYYFGDVYVDITDSWIDKEAVMDFADITSLETEEDEIQYAIACYDYYGAMEFENRFEISGTRTRKEVENVLQYYIISDDVNW